MPPNPVPAPETLGDPAEWVDRYGDLLLRFACGRVSNIEAAEDLVQDTLLAAFRHRKQFDGKAALSTWLIAILRRKIADYYRAAEKSQEFIDSSSHADHFSPKGKWVSAPANWRGTPVQLAENAEFWSIFQDCFGGLPAHLGQAFQLREIAHASVGDVSRQIGITAENLAVRLHRARLLLRACLENKWFAP